MLYHNKDGRHPSLLVEDGETVTIGASGEHARGLSITKVRPRTTAALVVMAGMSSSVSPRLSDPAGFEQVDRADHLVNLSELDQDGRINGYSVSFIRGILQAMDPNDRVPSKSVERLITWEQDAEGCGCSGRNRTSHAAKLASGRTLADVTRPSVSPQSMTKAFRAYVPDFIADLGIFSLFTHFGDIVIGRNATLTMNPDIMFVLAANVLAYHGSRIVQRANYMNMDVSGTMRGSLADLVHIATTVDLRVNWTALAAQPATKP